MSFAFFDTESSGLLRRDLPLTDPSQPSIVQLACILTDAQFRHVAKFSTLINLDGASIEPGAEAVHGISESRTGKYGVNLTAALMMLQEFCNKAKTVVAYNIAFDRDLVTVALIRVGATGLQWRASAPKFECAMELATPILKIPGKYGDYRFPKLADAHAFLCPDVPYEKAHDALADVEATTRVYRAIKALDTTR